MVARALMIWEPMLAVCPRCGSPITDEGRSRLLTLEQNVREAMRLIAEEQRDVAAAPECRGEIHFAGYLEGLQFALETVLQAFNANEPLIMS